MHYTPSTKVHKGKVIKFCQLNKNKKKERLMESILPNLTHKDGLRNLIVIM